LIQNQLRGQLIQNSIIGIGFNVNQEVFPEDLPNAISLYQKTGEFFNLLDLTLKLSKSFLEDLEQNLNASEQTERQYLNNLYGLNELNSFKSADGNSFDAYVRGVSKDGKLQLDTGTKIREFLHGEVELNSRK